MSHTANASRDPFFLYPRNAVQTSEGTVELPILYYDTSNFVAMFRVDVEALVPLIDPGLVPVKALPGSGLLIVSCYEYRNTTVGVYNEVGIAALVAPAGEGITKSSLLSLYRPLDKQRVGVYVIDLPVTTQAANSAGREIWGYPKFVTRIDFSMTKDGFACTTLDPEGNNIMTLEGKPGPGVPMPPISPVTYSRLDNQLLRTLINVRGHVQACLPGSMRLSVGDSRHPMAERLRSLRLNQAKPMLVQQTEKFQSRLNGGVAIA
jgi:hypothetical protein